MFSKRHPVSPLEMDVPVGTSLMFVLLFNNHDCFLVSFLLQRNNQSGKRFRVDLLASCLPTHNLTWHIHFVYVHTETLSSPIFDSPISKWNTPLPIFPSQHLATHKHCPSEEGGHIHRMTRAAPTTDPTHTFTTKSNVSRCGNSKEPFKPQGDGTLSLPCVRRPARR